MVYLYQYNIIQHDGIPTHHENLKKKKQLNFGHRSLPQKTKDNNPHDQRSLQCFNEPSTQTTKRMLFEKVY